MSTRINSNRWRFNYPNLSLTYHAIEDSNLGGKYYQILKPIAVILNESCIHNSDVWYCKCLGKQSKLQALNLNN